MVFSATGLSMNTVSRAIRGSGYVSRQTAELVLKTVRELDYHPNRAAQDLRRRKSCQITVVAESYDYLHIEKLAAIKEYAAACGYTMGVHFTSEDYPQSTFNALLPDILEQNPAGLIIIASSGFIIGKVRELRRKIPCVMITFNGVPDIDCVYIDRAGGVYDAIRDNEMLRFELLSIVMGVWDYIKNSGKYEGVENRALETIGMVPGRRDTNRIRGEHLMTQHDIEGKWKDFDDSVAVGGWSMDDHPAKGFYASDRHPCRQKGHVPCYNIPFSSLYSNKVKNLMMAGRNISCSHVAFSSTRVMSTCAAVGQAVGTAAAICLDDKITPAQLRANPEKVKQLQQTLLRDDQTILGIKNTDPADLARSAKVTASESIADSAPENVISGITIDLPKQNKNRWVASAASKPWIKLEWSSPQKFSQVRFIFEPGNTALSQTGSDYLLKTMIRGPQPKIVREYQVTAVLEDGSEKVLADVKNNYQKLVVNKFDPVLAKALKVQVSATNGDPNVIIKEIRVEA